MTGTITNKVNYLRRIKWEIPNYFSHSQKADNFLESQQISFLCRTWRLRIYPNGLRSNGSVEWVGLYLLETTPGSTPGLFLTFRFSFEYYEDGKCVHYPSDGSYSCTNSFKGKTKKQTLYGQSKFIARNELNRKRAEILPDDVLNVLVEIDVTGYVDSFDVLADDFLTFLRSEQGSDVTLKAGGQSFKAHKLILGARSSVFASAFEKSSKSIREVPIDVEPACEPDAFRLFLEFIYTGRLENLPSENASGLLNLAAKYDVPDLKEKCLLHMRDNLSLETVCDVLDAANRHREELLLDAAKDLLREHVEEVTRTQKWVEFLKNNPALGTEILLSVVSETRGWRASSQRLFPPC